MSTSRANQLKPIFLFFLTAVFVLSTWISIFIFGFVHYLFFWVAAFILCNSIDDSGTALMETTVLLLVWWILWANGYQSPYFMFLPLMVIMTIWAGFQIRSKWAVLLVVLVSGVWLVSTANTLMHNFNGAALFLWLAAILNLFIYIVRELFQPKYAPFKTIDLILCSYSGNTGHLAANFQQGLESAGAKVTQHRFHYENEFKADLNGDALVLAFPVIGWKPSWSLMDYLFKELPSGNGKPVFILYSSAGGPENTFWVPWLLLKLKGYRVIGRHWAMYPINVATVRLGTKKFWKWLDSLLPSKKESFVAIQAGKIFALGEKCGLPFILWPFALIIPGVLLDNPWLNRFAYRNWVMRWRCIKCGLCVRTCPVQRLSMPIKYPKAKGTCILCLNCVNLCPTKAMQMAGFTEYGNQYWPRWPKYVIKNRKSIQ
jgi:ferredoxin